MAIFVRRWSRNLKIGLLCLSTVLFGTSTLLMVTTIQDFNQRIVSIRGGQDGLDCPSLDDVSVQLMRILGQWESQMEATGRRRESVGNDDGFALSLAVQTLTDNGLMAEERNVRRLFYLAEVLQTFKERRSQVGRDENVTAKIADLVKIFAEVTNNRTTEGKNDHHYPPPKKASFYNESESVLYIICFAYFDLYSIASF